MRPSWFQAALVAGLLGLDPGAALSTQCEVIPAGDDVVRFKQDEGRSLLEVLAPPRRSLRFLVEGSVSVPVRNRRALYGVLLADQSGATPGETLIDGDGKFLMYATDDETGEPQTVRLWIDYRGPLAESVSGTGMTNKSHTGYSFTLTLQCRDFREFLGTQPPADARRSARHRRALDMATRRFAEAFIDHQLVFENRFLDVPIWQNPMDLWMMQRLITQVRPDVIIETGTAFGGSSLYYAVLLDQLAAHARVITIDVDPDLIRNVGRAQRYSAFARRVRLVRGDSVAQATLRAVKSLLDEVERDRDRAEPGRIDQPLRVLVTLDSMHSTGHVLEELRRYEQFVSPGGYIVVQDTIIDREPRYLDWFVRPWVPQSVGGPARAVDAFLAEHRGFVRDRDWEAYALTFYPGGFLKRVR